MVFQTLVLVVRGEWKYWQCSYSSKVVHLVYNI